MGSGPAPSPFSPPFIGSGCDPCSSQSTVSTQALAGASSPPAHFHSQSSGSFDNGPTPPTSPLLESHSYHEPGSESKKRRRVLVPDSDGGSDGEFLPSPSASTPTTLPASPMISRQAPITLKIRLRGGGKRPPAKSRRQAQPSSQTSSYSASSHVTHVKGQQSRRTTRSKARRASSPSDLVTTSLEEIALEDAAVKNEINRLGLALRDVKGDGNCLFRVLSDQGFGGEKRHAEIRKLVCDYLESHKAVMEGFVVPFMKDGEVYEGYVSRMRQLKQFGSHIEIQAAARVFKRNIRVVMSTTSFTIPWRTEAVSSPVFDTPTPSEVGPVHPSTPSRGVRRPDDTPSATSAVFLPPVREERGMLWLALFSQAEHFQSIRRAGDREHGPAEVEDRLAIPHQRDVSEAARRERGEVIVEKVAASLESKVGQLLASLPTGHGMDRAHAEGVLARVKGDIGEAVEILLEEIMEAGGSSDSQGSANAEDSLSMNRRASDYRSRSDTSPSNTATTSTESRSLSLPRSNSDISEYEKRSRRSSSHLSRSSCTSDSAVDDTPWVKTHAREKALSHGLEEMGLDQVQAVDMKRGVRDGGTPTHREERRRSARLGVVVG